MRFIKHVKIRSYEMGLYFRRGEFNGLLRPGSHLLFDPLLQVDVEVVSRRAPWLVHAKIDVIVKSGALAGQGEVIDLKDHERALVWIDGRFSHIVSPGLYAYWSGHKQVKVEVVDARSVRFEHGDLKLIARSPLADRMLDVCAIERNQVGVLFQDGRYVETLSPGLYAFWRGSADAKVVEIDTRESLIEVGGQEIMTADKVTLRLNAMVGYRVVAARRAVTASDDAKQALYREAQLALRAVVGVRDLDSFLGDKDVIAREVEEQIVGRAGELGLEVVSVGVRDVILPGDMKDLMNRVTVQKMAAEAKLSDRR